MQKKTIAIGLRKKAVYWGCLLFRTETPGRAAYKAHRIDRGLPRPLSFSAGKRVLHV
jgi:hypothetical protein